jgi:hypothetical protein
LRQGKLPDAGKHYRAALQERETLLKITPKPPEEVAALKNEIAHSRLYLGDFLLMAHNDRAGAAKEYAIAMDLFAALLKAEPDSLDLRQRIAAVHYRLGVVADDPAKAAEAFAECLRLREMLAKIDPNDVQPRIELMLALGRVGRAPEAEKLAEGLLTLKERSPQTVFQVACGLSVAAGGANDPVVAARCRDRAFAVLEDLLKTGWKDRGSLQLDPDLAALRADGRFAELLKKF